MFQSPDEDSFAPKDSMQAATCTDECIRFQSPDEDSFAPKTRSASTASTSQDQSFSPLTRIRSPQSASNGNAMAPLACKFQSPDEDSFAPKAAALVDAAPVRLDDVSVP